ncbi:MAG: type II toxin-antitoxin system RelE/ParE family toxin [Gammaproteobacteria bacterium]
MIRNFLNRGLAELHEAGHSRYIRPDLVRRALRRLDAMDSATRPEQLRLPGFNFHQLKGSQAKRYSVHVNGPWCITFGWADDDAVDVDLVNYH